MIAPKENFYRELLHADHSSALKYIQSRLDSIEMLSTTVQCDLSERKLELKFYLELLLESGNNLSEDSLRKLLCIVSSSPIDFGISFIIALKGIRRIKENPSPTPLT